MGLKPRTGSIAARVERAWHRLVSAWPHEPDSRPPASEADLANLETLASLTLPESFKALYRITDGCGATLLPQGLPLSSCAEIAEDWASHVRIADELDFGGAPETADDEMHVEFGWDQRRRLIIGARDDIHICLDFAPAERGSEGQVLLLENECEYVVVGRDLLLLLERWGDLIESGAVSYDDRYGYFTESRRRPRAGSADLFDLIRVRAQ